MSWSNYPNTHARTDLLTYLVVSQLIRRCLTGRWLTVQHVVESTHLWMHVNGSVDLLQRVALTSCAQDIAIHLIRVSKMRFDAEDLAGALFDSVNLDYQSPAVVEVHRACLVHIMSGARSSGHPIQRDGK